MGTRSKRYRKRLGRTSATATAKRLRDRHSKKHTALPKKYRRYSIPELLVMPFFWLCEEVTNRIRYQLWRRSHGRIR